MIIECNNVFQYFVLIIAFIGGTLLLGRCFGEVFGKIPTYTNSDHEIDVSPFIRANRLCLSVLGLFMLGIYIYVVIPIFLETPKIIAGIANQDELQYLLGRKVIAFFWLIIIIGLLIITAKEMLTYLSKRVKVKKRCTEVYLWGIDYPIALCIRTSATCICMLAIVCLITDRYNFYIDLYWKVGLCVNFILTFLIDGLFYYQKIYIFDNGLVTFKKYKKECITERDNLDFVLDDTSKVTVKVQGKNQLIIYCNYPGKEEIKNLINEEK